ncbi:mother-specific HO expression [Elasticomyces elasticus]|uniref:Mother-specific HO expression n=1 Tax=Exophiala sideris TaxID=1016849 RepID=A0ABR0IXG7_9EURO|nr:mother-specific HO expression [Elasticomyces elasticus]KAK5022368.1 mother-specific HO expression [Exophiala sideris]KAK5027274.1 mother-specific HO expression [Exophiala sideris]KAK5051222.1 mother-specific HO expression [Exophiala sideris]KAK5177814.1 mother-specific HO expression [Eurotiomycetes sp. CCFEE 6388]
MSEVDGMLKEQIHHDASLSTHGRVASASMMRSVMTSSETSSATPETTPWSSAIGHAATGKSGRVIERLQVDIDRLRREKQAMKMHSEETEKANENLVARNQSLQDRNSNYEQSHEANLRQLARRERQVEELREELRKEKLRTAKAEEQSAAATSSEETWRKQASQAKAHAAQKESEYDTIVTCRKVDYDRHQSGLDKIRARFDTLLMRQDEDLEKQKKLEIIAEQQRQTISQLEDLTRKLTTNFKAYRHEIDAAVNDLQEMASKNDEALTSKLVEMTEVTARMRWVMNVVNHGSHASDAHKSQITTNGYHPASDKHSTDSGGRSPTKAVMKKHRRKDSSKVTN